MLRPEDGEPTRVALLYLLPKNAKVKEMQYQGKPLKAF
jgi:hypothetical protein